MSDLKKEFEDKAAKAHNDVAALCEKAEQAGSETLKYNLYQQAEIRQAEAITLENCAAAIVDTEQPK